ncbi:MAG TPA: DNA alkylation repair protein [Longimicrobiales bacterium]
MSAISPAVEAIEKELRGLGDPEVAASLARFFKTGPGEYGEGDRFLGIRVPVLRKLARKHQSLALSDCRALLVSPYHEARLLALLILVRAYDRGTRNGARRSTACTWITRPT